MHLVDLGQALPSSSPSRPTPRAIWRFISPSMFTLDSALPTGRRDSSGTATVRISSECVEEERRSAIDVHCHQVGEKHDAEHQMEQLPATALTLRSPATPGACMAHPGEPQENHAAFALPLSNTFTPLPLLLPPPTIPHNMLASSIAGAETRQYRTRRIRPMYEHDAGITLAGGPARLAHEDDLPPDEGEQSTLPPLYSSIFPA